MNSQPYEVISASDYDSLPCDPEEAFVALEAICQRNMNRMIDDESSNDFYAAVRMEYAETVAACARECGILRVVNALPLRYNYDEFEKFLRVVKGVVAGIRFRNRRVLNESSVLLEQNTKTKIEHYIIRLRELIECADLSADRKDALLRKLEELRSELSKPRFNFAKAFTALSVVLAGLGATTTIAADGPSAVINIIRLVGKDRETEEAATKRLAPPVRALPAPNVKTPSAGSEPSYKTSSPVDDLDAEIPF